MAKQQRWAKILELCEKNDAVYVQNLVDIYMYLKQQLDVIFNKWKIYRLFHAFMEV